MLLAFCRGARLQQWHGHAGNAEAHLKATSANESVFTVRGTRDPADVAVLVEPYPLLAQLGGEELHAVVVDEDGTGTALACIRLHSLLERLNRGGKHGFQILLVDGHLNRDVGQVVVDHLVRTWWDGRVVLRVLVVLADRTNAHGDILYDLEGKELHGGLVSGAPPHPKRL